MEERRRSGPGGRRPIHLNQTQYKDRYMQFRTEGMSKAEYAEFLAGQQMVRIVLGESDVASIRALAEEFRARTVRLLKWMDIFFPAARLVTAIVCEDIFNPVSDPEIYGRTMERLLGTAALGL